MVAYNIDYKVKGDDRLRNLSIDAKDVASAKRKIGKRHGYKDGRMIQIQEVHYVGFF